MAILLGGILTILALGFWVLAMFAIAEIRDNTWTAAETRKQAHKYLAVGLLVAAVLISSHWIGW